MSASDRELFASAVAEQRLLIGDALGTFSAQLRGPGPGPTTPARTGSSWCWSATALASPWPPAPPPAAPEHRLAADPGPSLEDTAPQSVIAAGPGPRLAQRGPGTQGTHRGLPRRVRQASLVPQLRGTAEATPEKPPETGAGRQPRSPEMTRSLMSALQDGWQRGRADDLDDPQGGPDEGGAG